MLAGSSPWFCQGLALYFYDVQLMVFFFCSTRSSCDCRKNVFISHASVKCQPNGFDPFSYIWYTHILSIIVLVRDLGNRNLLWWGFPWNELCRRISRRKTVHMTLAQCSYLFASVITSQIFAQDLKKVDNEFLLSVTFCPSKL